MLQPIPNQSTHPPQQYQQPLTSFTNHQQQGLFTFYLSSSPPPHPPIEPSHDSTQPPPSPHLTSNKHSEFVCNFLGRSDRNRVKGERGNRVKTEQEESRLGEVRQFDSKEGDFGRGKQWEGGRIDRGQEGARGQVEGLFNFKRRSKQRVIEEVLLLDTGNTDNDKDKKKKEKKKKMMMIHDTIKQKDSHRYNNKHHYQQPHKTPTTHHPPITYPLHLTNEQHLNHHVHDPSKKRNHRSLDKPFMEYNKLVSSQVSPQKKGKVEALDVLPLPLLHTPQQFKSIVCPTSCKRRRSAYMKDVLLLMAGQGKKLRNENDGEKVEKDFNFVNKGRGNVVEGRRIAKLCGEVIGGGEDRWESGKNEELVNDQGQRYEQNSRTKRLFNTFERSLLLQSLQTVDEEDRGRFNPLSQLRKDRASNLLMRRSSNTNSTHAHHHNHSQILPHNSLAHIERSQSIAYPKPSQPYTPTTISHPQIPSLHHSYQQSPTKVTQTPANNRLNDLFSMKRNFLRILTRVKGKYEYGG